MRCDVRLNLDNVGNNKRLEERIKELCSAMEDVFEKIAKVKLKVAKRSR